MIRVAARPAKADMGRGGVVIQPYRGFGSREEVFLMGRVFRQERRPPDIGEKPFLRDLVDLFRRHFRRGVPHAVMDARFNGTGKRIEADRRGHFQARFRRLPREPSESVWQKVRFELVRPAGSGSRAEGRIYLPPSSAQRVVISDIDDTVVFTGVANKLIMVWRLFVQNARSRTAFPGVAALYRALHRGPSGNERNPMLYVSRGPWSIYEVLEEFFQIHEIPAGPVLFLRDWDLALYKPFPPRARGHKRTLIHRMLSVYSDLPFILIGDSGQRDPEIYADIVRRHPGRVLAIYIRKVGNDPERERAVEELGRQVTAFGSSLLLAPDSFDMAAHAAEHGYISQNSLLEVLKEREEELEADARET
jgi:phosphatidate phosphatase APP1